MLSSIRQIGIGGGLELLALAAGGAVWAWWLGPQQQHAVEWAADAPWGLRLDALGLLFLTLFLAVPAPAPAADRAAPPGRRPRWPERGLWVCRIGVALAALAAQTSGQIAGLIVAIAGIALAAWPVGWGRGFAPLLLIPVAWSGVFDTMPAPGRPIPVLPWYLVLLALLAAGAGAGAWPFTAPEAAHPPVGKPQLTPRATWIAALYGAGCLLPLLRSLHAGAWDGWARLVVLAAGLLTLAAAACAALAATDTVGAARATRHYLAGALLVGLGLGAPGAVGGGLILFVTGLAGLALADGSRVPHRVGLGAAAGLPPLLGFAGMWLLIGAGSAAPALLVTVAIPVAALLVTLAHARLGRPGTTPPAGWLLAGGLLLGGLAPTFFLDNVLRPALNTLAAGLPALSEVQTWAGIGLLLTRGPAPQAIWPVWGILAGIILTLALAEGVARLTALRRGPRLATAPAADPAVREGDATGPACSPLMAEAAAWERWVDPASLARAGYTRWVQGRRAA